MPNVLVVEDDPDQLNRLVVILRQYESHFAVIPAADGRDAIRKLRDEAVDLVVTDILMPDINGIMLLAYVHTYHPQLPCIVVTAYGTARLRSKLPDGILRFFQKPVDVHDLAHAIIAYLDQSPSLRTPTGISLLSFLGIIEMEKSSCVFEIKAPGQPKGYLYFENGVLVDARSGDLAGEPAALELIARKQATYGFNFAPPGDIPRRIKADLQDLVRNVLGRDALSADG